MIDCCVGEPTIKSKEGRCMKRAKTKKTFNTEPNSNFDLYIGLCVRKQQYFIMVCKLISFVHGLRALFYLFLLIILMHLLKAFYLLGVLGGSLILF